MNRTAPNRNAIRLSAIIDPHTGSQARWIIGAECTEHDLDFNIDTPAGPRLQVCGSCLARTACLEYALTNGDSSHGVWGGTTRSARSAMLRTAKATSC